MTASTREYAEHVLETQRQHAANNPHDKEQRAYYEGMRAMLEIILTNGYNNNMEVSQR